ncbi:MAG: hypothetical protein M3314_04635 [Actinomycetota bacterium]|nr:hypothetical protein [Actinomycetota bacterium]
MNRPVTWRLAVLPLTTVVVLAVSAATAGAHEPRTSGGLRFVVGWGEEPAYSGLKNSVQVIVTDAAGSPITDVGDSLRVEVKKGSEAITLPLEAGPPGEYRAWLTPTRPGTYVVRLTGSVRGQPVDESFTSSDTTFNDVEDLSAIQFPAKEPSTGEVATRLDRQIPRLEAALRAADDRVEGARTVAVVAVTFAVLSLAVAGLALVAAKRRRPAGGAEGTGTGSDSVTTQGQPLHP